MDPHSAGQHCTEVSQILTSCHDPYEFARCICRHGSLLWHTDSLMWVSQAKSISTYMETGRYWLILIALTVSMTTMQALPPWTWATQMIETIVSHTEQNDASYTSCGFKMKHVMMSSTVIHTLSGFHNGDYTLC